MSYFAKTCHCKYHCTALRDLWQPMQQTHRQHTLEFSGQIMTASKRPSLPAEVEEIC